MRTRSLSLMFFLFRNWYSSLQKKTNWKRSVWSFKVQKPLNDGNEFGVSWLIWREIKLTTLRKFWFSDPRFNIFSFWQHFFNLQYLQGDLVYDFMCQFYCWEFGISPALNFCPLISDKAQLNVTVWSERGVRWKKKTKSSKFRFP